MRETLLFLLLVGTAGPGFAADTGDRESRRAERAERARQDDSDRRAERAERRARSEQPEGEGRPAIQEQPQDEDRPAMQEQLRERHAVQSGDGDADHSAVVQRRAAPHNVRNWRASENSPAVIEPNRSGAQRLRQRIERRAQPIERLGSRREDGIRHIPREGTQPPARIESRSSRHSNHHRWRGDWRSDRRYDWRNHRRRHSSLFRFGFYHDPFGWGYRPFSIGWRLWPSYYSRSYWLNDPWQYRLPYAPPGYRWIRYYNDAILVDTWDGQVVDVIRNFFW